MRSDSVVSFFFESKFNCILMLYYFVRQELRKKTIRGIENLYRYILTIYVPVKINDKTNILRSFKEVKTKVFVVKFLPCKETHI